MIDFNRLHIDVGWHELYSNYREAIVGMATWLDGYALSNPPDLAKRWNRTNQRPEIYNKLAATWGPLLDMTDDQNPYLIRVQEANHADSADYADEAGDADYADTAGVATNAVNLGNIPAASYAQTANLGTSSKYNVGTARDQIPLSQNLQTGAWTPVGTAATRNVGINNGEIPLKESFATGAWTTVGTAAKYNMGLGDGDIPKNSLLGEAAWRDVGTGSDELVTTSRITTAQYTTTNVIIAGASGWAHVPAPAGYRFCAYFSSTARLRLIGISSVGASVTVANDTAAAATFSFVWVRQI